LIGFDETWNANAYWPSEPYRPEKNQNLKIHDGRRPSHSENENHHLQF